jgi:putative ABC transport system substrate-binding protein
MARAQGQVEGQHWRFEHRHADGDATRGAAIIRELAALPVQVFVMPGPAAARAVRRATTTPLVAIGLPPVRSDPELCASFARPGGSVTGFASLGEEMSARRIELLRETVPGLAAIGVLHDAADPTFDAWGRLTEASAAAQGLRAADAGALSSFGASLPDLPVQLPAAIGFVVNLRAARALGLVVPHAILARAEEVIE